MRNSFSVVIPAYNREKTISRAVASVINQSYDNYEIILVDDASTDDTLKLMNVYKEEYENIKLVTHGKRQERIASRNDGMVMAENDWICWLDSDDEYMTNYLEVFNDAINLWPEYRIFNCGSIIHYRNKENEFFTKTREVFKPEVEGKGHVNFKSGKMGTGVFIFKRELLDEIPLMTPCFRPYGDPGEVVGDMGPMGQVNPNPNYPIREDGQWVPFGNPWGDDFHFSWLLTRENQMKSLDMLLYIEHKRA